MPRLTRSPRLFGPLIALCAWRPLLALVGLSRGMDEALSYGRERSGFDEHVVVFQQDPVSLDRNHAGRGGDLAGANIKLAVVKVAFDLEAVEISLRQRAGPMCALVIGHVEHAADIVDRQRQVADLNANRAIRRDLSPGTYLQ